jgi:streptogramin lyase
LGFTIVHHASICTIAGIGTYGYNRDDVPATSAQLNWPYGVAVDSARNIYIADYNNHRIRKVDSSGKITTIAGNGTYGYSGDGGQATLAQLNHPWGVTVDSVGNIYIVDRSNHCIRKAK